MQHNVFNHVVQASIFHGKGGRYGDEQGWLMEDISTWNDSIEAAGASLSSLFKMEGAPLPYTSYDHPS